MRRTSDLLNSPSPFKHKWLLKLYPAYQQNYICSLLFDMNVTLTLYSQGEYNESSKRMGNLEKDFLMVKYAALSS